ncbi:hypothetical protein Metho_1193 [Methanomethylovorans hollandica DSM 15978]|uniref:Uncharacterized protein n=1 Tax=Methanomethylovorans hollandica (strain DSM 15978 / NBRC 107637 / DMS1) TaxID=867904 RepID=L0KZA8_METHD|nr:hypothetical protein [Methanomethylovorans hollandica]AGB49423.1 hypothetical protein Metho_1193 [Methanomethylovorans hollandica DSM 15978]
MPSFDLPLLQEKYVLQQHEIELLKRTVAHLQRENTIMLRELEIIKSQRGTTA